MKKLGKFIFGTLSLAALAGGVFYFLKNFANKTATDDFDDFEDDFDDDFEDDFDSLDSEEIKKKNDKKDSREYVTINLTQEDSENNTTQDSVTTEENTTAPEEDTTILDEE